MLKTVALIFGVLLVGLLAYVRLAPSDPKVWHVDPLKAKKPSTPNAFLMLPDTGETPAEVFSMPAAELAAAFDRLLLALPNTRRLAGSPEALFTTYIARTPLMRYPDYISVRAVPLENGRAALAVFSRARFGYSDRGVNRKRILGLLAKLRP